MKSKIVINNHGKLVYYYDINLNYLEENNTFIPDINLIHFQI